MRDAVISARKRNPTLIDSGAKGMPGVEHLKVAVLDTHAWFLLSAGDAQAAVLKNFRGRAAVCPFLSGR